MKKQQGFTLIELIVVIVILGILAVTAAPKFIDVQSDARYAALSGLEGAINGANTMAYGKSALDGDEGDTTDTIEMGGQNVSLVYGYLAATSANLQSAIGFVAADWDVDDTTTAGTLVIAPKGQGVAAADTCKITYVQATAASGPTLTKTATGASSC